ncbi:prealbumin-like fold domain-containing protein [Nocardioides sp. Iso805N]|uniref:prealbumin-like fold domain-containing protein n=1 Tax=Nocardioides sp. Iso805N TaxID=1283287 RepID=UPI0003796B5B|nr:prealbumin-like fold domain-containing protein [Nocardioides sp. Iso805N]
MSGRLRWRQGRVFGSARRRFTLSLNLLVVAGVVAAFILSNASAGMPGGTAQGVTADLVPAAARVPAPGTPVYTEDFSNQNATAGAISILNYTGGAAAANQTYTADTPYTPAGNQCDGWILNSSTPLPSGDGGCANNQPAGWGQIQQMAKQLGLAQGQSATQAASNQALSEYTNATSGTIAAGTEFKTTKSNSITAIPGHYYAVSAYFAEVNCPAAGRASETFSLITYNAAGVGTSTVLGSGLNPCTDLTNWDVQIQKLQSAAIQVPPGTVSLGLSLYNATTTGSGNDVAFDLPQIVDVTPIVDKSLSPALVEPTQTSVLTLTITNTSELMAKTDWGFVDNLPAGLTLANTTFGGTCAQQAGAALSKTGTTGGSTITVTGGDLGLNQTSCTITANVTSATENTYTNSPSNPANMTLSGLLPGDPGTVQFLYPRLTLVKALGSARAKSGDQFNVAIRTGSGTGAVVSSTANATTQGTGSTVTAGTGTTGTYVATSTKTYYLTESGINGADLSLYNATLTCVDSTGRTTGLPTNAAYTGNNAITPAIGANITCTLTNSASAPTITLTKALGSARAADTDQFTVAIHTGSATGPVANPLTNSTTTGTGSTVSTGSGTTGAVTATAGTSYYLTEAAAGTTTLANYTKTITCTDASGIQTGLPTNAAFGASLQITPVAAARISCTITNTAVRADVYLHKVGQSQSGATVSLGGSQWQLQADASGAPGATVASGVQPVSGQTGEFKMTGLLPGTYWLTETTAPSNYTLLAQPIRFTVATDGTVTLVGGANSTASLGTATGGAPEITVHDPQPLTLPLAGGSGTKAFALVGALLLIAAGLVLLILRRRSASDALAKRRVGKHRTDT